MSFSDTLRSQAASQSIQPEHRLLSAAANALDAQRRSLREMRQLLLDLDLGRSIHNSRFPDKEIDGPLWAQINRVTAIAKELLETL